MLKVAAAEQVIKAFGNILTTDEFLRRAQGSMVVKFSVTREDREERELAPAFGARMIELKVTAGVPSRHGEIQKDDQNGALLIPISRGWTLTETTTMNQLGFRWNPIDAAITSHDVGIQIENPTVAVRTDDFGQDVNAFLLGLSGEARLTVAGMEDYSAILARLNRRASGDAACFHLARLADVCVTMTSFPALKLG